MKKTIVRKPRVAVAPGKSDASAKSAGKTRSAPRPAKNLLAAGFKALTNVHEEAVTRQSRVFESLLGIHAGRDSATPAAGDATSPLAVALDPFGFRKFEDVFDQRVARALANLGIVSAEEFAALRAEVEQLRARVARLEAWTEADVEARVGTPVETQRTVRARKR